MGILATRIIKARERKGWTQGQLATYSRVDQSSISKIEGGARTNVGVETLAKIAWSLETTIDYLVGGTDDPRPLAVVQSPESRELRTQIGSLLADEKVERMFRLLLLLSPEDRQTAVSFVEFLARRSR